jgi:starvation-inducible DNA-binding protein
MAVEINTGFTGEQRKETALALTKLLADTYALYLKTHGYHWNVRGPQFSALHTLFETHYNELWAAVDTLAERVRALGEFAPQGYGAFANLTSIKDGDPENSSDQMVEELMRDEETAIATCRAALKPATDADDQVTIDLLTQRLTEHEKHAWMLRATLGGK